MTPKEAADYFENVMGYDFDGFYREIKTNQNASYIASFASEMRGRSPMYDEMIKHVDDEE